MNCLLVEKTDSKDSITFVFEGRIDTNNSIELSDYIFNNINSNNKVVFDFKKINYISSAGLRVVLKVAKEVKGFKIINLTNDVYEIFEMTGFSQMINVSKALKEISINGKPVIGEGYMGKVYRLDPETIIKVYLREDSLDSIKREVELSKKAFVLGIPTAIPFDVVKVKEGGYGSVFELLDCDTLNKLIIAHPENLDKYISKYIEVLKQILSTEIKDQTLPQKTDTAFEWLKYLRNNKLFDEKTLQKLDILLNSLPNSTTLIHGDYHVKNIMVQNDEFLLIDMDTLGQGHQIFEISAFFLSYIGYPTTDPNNTVDFFGLEKDICERIFNETFNSLYKNRSKKEQSEIYDKISLLSYMWLTYKTHFFEPENESRLNHAKQQVLKFIDKYNSLSY